MGKELVLEIKTLSVVLDFTTIYLALLPWEIIEFLGDSLFICKMTVITPALSFCEDKMRKYVQKCLVECPNTKRSLGEQDNFIIKFFSVGLYIQKS